MSRGEVLLDVLPTGPLSECRLDSYACMRSAPSYGGETFVIPSLLQTFGLAGGSGIAQVGYLNTWLTQFQNNKIREFGLKLL